MFYIKLPLRPKHLRYTMLWIRLRLTKRIYVDTDGYGYVAAPQFGGLLVWEVSDMDATPDAMNEEFQAKLAEFTEQMNQQ